MAGERSGLASSAVGLEEKDVVSVDQGPRIVATRFVVASYEGGLNR